MQTPLFQETLTVESFEQSYAPDTELQVVGDVWIENGDLYVEYGYDTLGDDREFNITLSAGTDADYSTDRFETHNGQGTSTVVFAQIPAEPGHEWLITIGTTDGEYGASQYRVKFGSSGGDEEEEPEQPGSGFEDILTSPLFIGGMAALVILLIVLASR